MMAIRSFQPYPRKVLHTLTNNTDEFRQEYRRYMSPWRGLDDFVTFDKTKLHQFSEPVEKLVYYLVDKPQTRTTVQQMRAAEQNLNGLCEAVDQFAEKKFGKDLAGLLGRTDCGGRQIRRTPPWIKLKRTPRVKDEATVTNDGADSSVAYVSVSIHDHDPASAIIGQFGRLKIVDKEKIKTKARLEDEDALTQKPTPQPGSPSDEAALTPSPTLRVNKRAFDVFTILVHTHSSPRTAGKIPWTEMVYAMVHIGFSLEKLHGSAWHFDRKEGDEDTAIQFHEPHPVRKLAF